MMFGLLLELLELHQGLLLFDLTYTYKTTFFGFLIIIDDRIPLFSFATYSANVDYTRSPLRFLPIFLTIICLSHFLFVTAKFTFIFLGHLDAANGYAPYDFECKSIRLNLDSCISTLNKKRNIMIPALNAFFVVFMFVNGV
jgi:hypothetical protein